MGSIFRSADAFGVEKIYLCGYTPTPPHPEISKTALGAEITIPWVNQTKTHRAIEDLRTKGIYILALEKNKKSIPLAKLTSKTRAVNTITDSGIAIILGNEIHGITAQILKRADAVAHIPMLGKKESLNVSVAAGIALYHFRNL